jgi:hypothetical protein
LAVVSSSYAATGIACKLRHKQLWKNPQKRGFILAAERLISLSLLGLEIVVLTTSRSVHVGFRLPLYSFTFISEIK